MRNIYNSYQKQAQVKRMLSRLDRLVREDRFQAMPGNKRKNFVHRLRRLIRQLKLDLSGLNLRPAMLGILTALGIGTATQTARAQNFLPQVQNAFGLTGIGNYEAKPALVDIDGDGDLDLFVGSEPGDVFFFENIGTATAPAFDTLQTNPFGIAGGDYYVAPSFEDMDNDGDYDMFLGESYPIALLYFENTGTNIAPAFAAPATNPFGLNFTNLTLAAPYEAKPGIADLDGDGDYDLLVSVAYGEIIYFENTGTNAAPAFATGLVNPFGFTSQPYYASPTIGDLDVDGDLDVGIWTNNGNFNYFENTGTNVAPAFAAPTILPFGIQPGYYYTGGTLGDLDNDGDLDLIMGNGDGDLFYQENTPATANQAPILVLGTNSDTICEIDTLGPISVMATDPDLTTPTVLAYSTNQAVIPDANISINGVAPNYMLTAVPILDGSAEIVVVASDSITSAADTISVTVDDCIIAINESFFAKEFEVYPNPADKRVRYRIDLHAPVGSLRLELTDLHGRVVQVEQINDGGSQFNGELDVSQHAAGVYFLRVRTNLYRFNRKLVIE